MPIKEQLDKDLKAALLEGRKDDATTYRGLKSVLQNEAIAKNKQAEGLSEEEAVAVFAKEAKKRQESAGLYQKANEPERANKELHEKELIEQYLPKQLSDEELNTLVDDAIADKGEVTQQTMGLIIGAVKSKAGNGADGSRIAALVKQRMVA